MDTGRVIRWLLLPDGKTREQEEEEEALSQAVKKNRHKNVTSQYNPVQTETNYVKSDRYERITFIFCSPHEIYDSNKKREVSRNIKADGKIRNRREIDMWE